MSKYVIKGFAVFRQTNTVKVITEQVLPLELPKGIVIEKVKEDKAIADNMRDYWKHIGIADQLGKEAKHGKI